MLLASDTQTAIYRLIQIKCTRILGTHVRTALMVWETKLTAHMVIVNASKNKAGTMHSKHIQETVSALGNEIHSSLSSLSSPPANQSIRN